MPEATGAARPIVVRSGILGRVIALLLLLHLATAVMFMLTLGHEVEGVGQWLSWLFASLLSLTTILLSVGLLAAGVRLTLRVSGAQPWLMMSLSCPSCWCWRRSRPATANSDVL